MRTAFYRIPGTPGKGIFIDAETLTTSDVRKLRSSKNNLYCPNCGEHVIYSSETQNHRPGEKWYHAPRFNHQSASKCNIEECELRVDQAALNGRRYISQRVRTPLFLRPDGKGNFVLSVGFSSANKEALRQLQESKYKSLRVRRGRTELGAISIEELLEEKGEGFVYMDLPSPIARNNKITIELQNSSGENFNEPLQETHNPEWSDRIDWFADSNVGAVFQYSAGNAGEKIPAGGCITAGRPYLVVEKDTRKSSSFVGNRLETVAKKYGLVYEHQGWLEMSQMTSQYAVRKIVFPSSSDMKNNVEYESLVNWLLERFAVQLCDEIPETRPVWPPASRKSDAYAIQPTSEASVYVIATNPAGNPKGNLLYLHRDYEKTEEHPLVTFNDLSVGRIPLFSRRTPVSLSGSMMPAVASYRGENYKDPPAPYLIIEFADQTILLDAPGTHEIEIPADKTTATITGACRYTVYENENSHSKQVVNPGEKHTVDLYDRQRILLQSSAGSLYSLKFRQEFADSDDSDMYDQAPDNSIGNKCKRYNRYTKYEQRYARY